MYGSQKYEEPSLMGRSKIAVCDVTEHVLSEMVFRDVSELSEYDVASNLDQARKLLLEVSKFYSQKSIVGDDLTVLSEIRNLALTINDIANSRYNNSDGPFKDNYGSGRSGIIHKTNCSRPNADSSIMRGKL